MAMAELINAVNLNSDFFFLAFLRVSGLLFTSIFGRRNIPNMAKIMFCLMLTIMLFPQYPKIGPLAYSSVWGYLGLCVPELLFGMVLGYVLNAFLMLVFTSGTLIDMQMGFGMVNVFDVQSNLSVPIMGNLLNLVLLMVFMSVNGHLKLIEILHMTFFRAPIGHVLISANIAEVALNVFARSFVLAVMIAMPVVGSGLVLEVALGIIVRTVPQMNVFVVGFPIKIMVGFIVMMVCIPVFTGLTGPIFEEMFEMIDRMFRGFASA